MSGSQGGSLLALTEALGLLRGLIQRNPSDIGEREMLERAAVLLANHCDVERCFVFMGDHSTMRCEAASRRGTFGATADAPQEYLALARHVAASGEALTGDWPGAGPVLCQPLEHAGKRVGAALWLMALPEPAPWHVRLVELLADLLAMAIVTSRALSDQSVALALSAETLRAQGERLSHLASHDSLTGLLNRDGLARTLRAMTNAGGPDAACHALVYLEVDRFGTVSDTWGASVGDQLVQRIGAEVERCVGDGECAGRVADSAFALVVSGSSASVCRERAEALCQAIARVPFDAGDHRIEPTVSVGVAPFSPDGVDVEELLRRARTACVLAREQGGNRVKVYHDGDTHVTARLREAQWVPRITQALGDDRLRLVAQPIVPLATEPGTGTPGYELLARLVDERGALVSAARFMPTAERYGLSTRIDRLVLDKALAWIRANPGHIDHAAFFTINISAHSLREAAFLEHLAGAIGVAGVPAGKLVFEITETATLSDLSAAGLFFEKLRAAGSRVALDDFGSGNTSFTYLRELLLDIVKIEGEFVLGMEASATCASLVRTINALGHELGLQTIAECVESEPVLETLREIGVDYAQGYALGGPVPLDGLFRR